MACPNLRTGGGEKWYLSVYPKRMKDWVVKPVFKEKTKLHVVEMLCSVLEISVYFCTGRDTGEVPLQKKIAPIPQHTHPRRTFLHSMYPDLEKIKQVKKI